jgi:zinc/manganese transport system substrate-binding protein
MRTASAKPPLKIVTTFSILGDVVKQVVGKSAEVDVLVGPNADVHVYEPKPRDAQEVGAANLVVFNGLGLEGWLPRLVAASASKALRVVATDGLQPIRNRSTHAQDLKFDPHCWQDVSAVRQYVANIARGLKAVDAENASFYGQRASAYDARLVTLDTWIHQQIETIPPGRRKVVTGHEAFAYFGRAYGVEFHSPLGVSTEGEPSARDMAAIISMARKEKIKALFIGNLTNPALLEQIARDADVVAGPVLYSDALSMPDGPAPTYEAMMRYNTTTLVAGMQKN